MVAERNIRQDEIADAQYEAAMARWRALPPKRRGPAPKPPAHHRQRPQNPRQAAAIAARSPQVKGSASGLAFWISNGMLRVS